MDANRQMPFETFVELALYHPEVGYYRRSQQRVGTTTGTDFFTSNSAGSLFGELVVAACISLLRGNDPGRFTFVEIGSEPHQSVLQNVRHPFAARREIQLGDPLVLEDRCIVFSNELFDAQPFKRLVKRNSRWHERGVQLEGEKLVEVNLRETTPPLPFPDSAPDGYSLDLSFAAETLAEKISAKGWSGLFLAFDYGRTWRELMEEVPGGTARAYYRHRQHNDLLARPGEQDLTAHVCWDWIERALKRNGFSFLALESQESFFVHHAGQYIAESVTGEGGTGTSARKRNLLQLLHPANMGQKFQALHAWRDA
jgi:SAM-dependent MidA family methyltransferase